MTGAIDPPWGTEWIGASPAERAAALVDVLGLADALPQGSRTEGSPPLREKVLTVDQALTRADIPHAIGGTIALAYYGEPRVTIDIDVNVFVSTGRLPGIERALQPLGVDPEHDERELADDQQVRLRWDHNPVHLFFSCDELHEAMPTTIRWVPLAGSTIPIVSPEHLVIRKAILDRPMDWLDIEAILVVAEPLDMAAIKSWLTRMVGPDDQRLTKLDEILARLALAR
jgi:hypothetical protein